MPRRDTLSAPVSNANRVPGIVSTLPTHQPAIARIVGAFVSQLPGKIESMWQSYEARDYECLGRDAHWLKGSGGTMGFACFTAPARKLLEETSPGHTPDDRMIEEQLEELADLLRNVTASPPAGSPSMVARVSDPTACSPLNSSHDRPQLQLDRSHAHDRHL